ncbi:hypothetical protein WNY78_06460 [Psychroserpens sp. AS72]|uniref:hypothetical protein n=1 Tax=Psychroserpens sp. AS72 TaxID=3135775 RepID=UPI00317AEE2F
MKYKSIYDKAEDSSWIVAEPGGYRRLYINPSQISIVKNWSLEDSIKLIPNKNPKPFHVEIKFQ